MGMDIYKTDIECKYSDFNITYSISMPIFEGGFRLIENSIKVRYYGEWSLVSGKPHGWGVMIF